METLFLLTIAVAPPLVFMYFIYWMDRHEPQSMRTILTAMFVGVLSVIPALIVQLAFQGIPLFHIGGMVGAFFESFLLVAPSEEFFKFLFVYLYIRKKPFYDEINDGIVYYGAGAIGFALLENIFYVLDFGFTVGMMRAFTSIPIHTFCGIIIGYHAGLARFSNQHKPGKLIRRGLFFAYLTHALFNTFVSAESFLVILFIPLVITVYVLGYKILQAGRQLSVTGEQTTENLALPAILKPSIRKVITEPPVINYRLEEVTSDHTGKKYLKPKKETWKAILGRILLAFTACLWLLVFIFGEVQPGEIVETILGMILLTFIPFMVGLLLELSYQRRKRVSFAID